MRRFISMFFMVLALPGITYADMPKRKPGLWEIKMTTSMSPGAPSVSQHCIDAKTDDMMQQRTQGMDQKACSKNSVRREGGKVIAESVCKFGETTATTKVVFSGDYSSRYRGDIHSTYSPPMRGMKESHSTLEAKWLGVCKAGQKPGDVIMPGMPGGGKFNNMGETMKKIPKW